MSEAKGSNKCCVPVLALFSRLCSKPKRSVPRIANAALRMSSTFNSSASSQAVKIKEFSSFMRQLHQSRKSSHRTQSLSSRVSPEKKQMSLASGRSFYRQLVQRHEGDLSFTCAEDYLDVAGVLILSQPVRIPQSRVDKDKLPAMRPRMNTV